MSPLTITAADLRPQRERKTLIYTFQPQRYVSATTGSLKSDQPLDRPQWVTSLRATWNKRTKQLKYTFPLPMHQGWSSLPHFLLVDTGRWRQCQTWFSQLLAIKGNNWPYSQYYSHVLGSVVIKKLCSIITMPALNPPRIFFFFFFWGGGCWDKISLHLWNLFWNSLCGPG